MKKYKNLYDISYYELNETFIHYNNFNKNVKLKTIESDDCVNCYFNNNEKDQYVNILNCSKLLCNDFKRRDNKNVKFVLDIRAERKQKLDKLKKLL